MADSKAKSATPPPVIKTSTPAPRRGFIAEISAVVIGGIVGVFPFAVGLAPFLDPLRRSGGGVRTIRVASLDSVPDDGVPRRFPVIADLTDAWTKVPNESIGSVYLIRDKGANEIRALNAICPHAGCFVNFVPSEDLFICPCHTSAFALTGERRLDISKVPPRAMDTLTCQIKDGAVYVDFQNFHTGLEEKVPKA